MQFCLENRTFALIDSKFPVYITIEEENGKYQVIGLLGNSLMFE